jgi:hypothetical protein
MEQQAIGFYRYFALNTQPRTNQDGLLKELFLYFPKFFYFYDYFIITMVIHE